MFKLLFGLHRGTEKERVKEELVQLSIPKIFQSGSSQYSNQSPFIIQNL